MGAVGAGGCQDQIPSPSCRMEAVALLCKGARCFLLGSGSKLQLCRAALGPGACSFWQPLDAAWAATRFLQKRSSSSACRNAEQQRILWKIPDISQKSENGGNAPNVRVVSDECCAQTLASFSCLHPSPDRATPARAGWG